MRHRRNHRNQRGIVLVAVCLCVLLMLAGLGLGIDLNRLLVAQQALRASAEAVAVAAALELDGTQAGLERARNRAGDTWRRQAPADGARIAVEFAPSINGAWSADPLASNDLLAVRVTAASAMPLTLLRGVIQEKSLPVSAVGRAGQTRVDDAESAAIAAQLSVSRLREIAQSDTDTVSASYAEYAAKGKGNGRRLVPLSSPDGHQAAFLLPSAGGEWKLEKAGGFLEGSRFRANAGNGVWRVEVGR